MGVAVEPRRHAASGADRRTATSGSRRGGGGDGGGGGDDDGGQGRRRTSTRDKIARMVAEGASNYPSYLKLIYTGDSEEPSSSDDELAAAAAAAGDRRAAGRTAGGAGRGPTATAAGRGRGGDGALQDKGGRPRAADSATESVCESRRRHCASNCRCPSPINSESSSCNRRYRFYRCSAGVLFRTFETNIKR